MRDEREERDRTATDEIEGDLGEGEVSGQGLDAEVRPLPSIPVGDGEATALVNPARSAAYEAAGRSVPIGERVERARRHVIHAEVLRGAGEERHAVGAMLAASIALLRAAVTPAASMIEHRTKLTVLHVGLAAVGLGAWHDHLAALIDAALQAEIDVMVAERLPVSHLTLADVSQEGAEVPRGCGSPAMSGCDASELEAYDALVSVTDDRTAILEAMTRSLGDEIQHRRCGRPDLARGARLTLEDFDLAACATLARTAVDADDKARLLASSFRFHRTRSPLVAAVIQAALELENVRWGPTVSGRA